MIYLYTGTPGSGKSLDLARVIINNIRGDSPVICNFNINLPKKYQSKKDLLNIKYDDELTVPFLVNYAKDYFKNHKFKESQIVLIIDEAQIMFNARSWNVKGRDEWIKFFSNHRHLGFDVILCCQFDLMIDKQIRSLVEYQIIHRKVSNFGLKGYILCFFFMSPQLFCRVKVWYPMGEVIDHMFYKFHKKYSWIYNSYDSTFVDSEVF